jgi:hypothetical protein
MNPTSLPLDLNSAFPKRLNEAERPVEFKGAGTSYAERHYRVGDLARMWGLGRETVRKLVKDDPGVIKVRMGAKKSHTVYSVPESAARRIHTRLLNTD